MTDLLLLAAFGPELAPLKPAFARSGENPATPPGPGRDDAAAAPMRGRFGALGVEARTCGIGLSAAAVHSSVQVREVRPRAVVLLGTCGVYRGFAPTGQSDRAELGIGDVIVSRRVLLADWATLEGHAQFPPATAAPLSADEHLTESLARAGAAPADVANTLGITVNDNVAARIAKSTGAGVEHLETYGVATACAAAGVPFAAVLGVANFVGSSGREEWRGHHVRASEAAAQLVLAWMQSIDDLGPHLGLRAS